MIFIAICSCLLTLASGKVNPDIEAGKSVDISVCVCVFMSIYRKGFICVAFEFQGTDQ